MTSRRVVAIVAHDAAGEVIGEQRAVAHVGERVTVHDEEVLVQAVDQRKRADRAERLVLTEVVDLDVVGRAVAEERLDELGQVARSRP